MFSRSHVSSLSTKFHGRTHLMLHKLTLPLSDDCVLSSAAHPGTTPRLCITSCHVVVVWLLPPTNYYITLMLHLCYCWHCCIATNSASTLQLPLICYCCNCNNYNWEASKILNRLCLSHMSLNSLLLLAPALSTEEFTLLLPLHNVTMHYFQYCTALLNIWLPLVCNYFSGIWLHHWHWSILLLNTVGPRSKVMIHKKDTSMDPAHLAH